MCLLIVAPDGLKMDKEHLENAQANNPDGIGVAFKNGNKMKVIKNISLKNLFDLLPKLQDTSCMVHFRLATIGKVNEKNCHPFQFNNWILAHNGHIYSPKLVIEGDDSDTLSFAKMMQNFSYEYLKNNIKLIKDIVGSSNKICFYKNDGSDFFIVNEEIGNWKNGIWFSNNSYLYNWKREFVIKTKDNDWEKYYYKDFSIDYDNQKSLTSLKYPRKNKTFRFLNPYEEY